MYPQDDVYRDGRSRTRSCESKRETVFLRMIEGAHPAGMSEVCESLFETMGYGPLRKFREADGGAAAFEAYAEVVCREMAQKLLGPAFADSNPEDLKSGAVALFGHAVFLNAVAFALACAAGADAETRDSLLDMDLGETHGILMDLASGKCQHMSVPN